MTGLTSGLDTESIVTALTSGYKSKVDKYKQQQTKVSWKQDAWKGINKKVYSLYTSLDSMRFSANWRMQKATSSNTSVANITSNGKAFTGSQKVTVDSVATTANLTSGQFDSGVTGSTTLGELGYTDKATKISVNGKDIDVTSSTTINKFVSDLQSVAGLNANFDETNRRIYISARKSGSAGDFDFTGDTNGIDVLSKLNLISSSTGSDGKTVKSEAATKKYGILLTGITLNENGGLPDTATATLRTNIDSVVKTYANAVTEEAEYKDQKAALTKGLNYASVYGQLHTDLDKYNIDITDSENASDLESLNVDSSSIFVGKDEYKYDSTNDIYVSGEGDDAKYIKKSTEDGKTVYSWYKKQLKDGSTDEYEYVADTANTTAPDAKNFTDYVKSSKAYVSVSAVMKKDDADVTDSEIIDKVMSIKSNYILAKGYEDDAKSSGKTVADGDTAAIVDLVQKAYAKDGKVDSAVSELTKARNTANENLTTVQKELSDNAVVKDLADAYTKDTSDDKKTYNSKLEEFVNDVKTAFDEQAQMNTAMESVTGDKAAIKNDGKAAKITVGGVTYTQDSNNFSVNGLSIQALSEGTTNVTVATDTQGLYDKIKNFFSTYNEVINELTDNFNAESSKGYDPLTDDQKSSMSDTQVEKWEKKAKSGLLRNDSTLNSIMNTITNTMLGSYEINGKKYSLATFGIKTKGILNAATNRQYEYHIDGDEDDESVASNSDKLMSALTEDPDSVIDFMQKLTNDLYTNLDKKMKRTSMKSAYTIYNDKEMASEYSSYTSLIKQWETRLSTMEESYYTKFSKMESTLSKLQSSTSSLTSSLSR
jgi:flagellar hook-associated protein 2